MTTQLWRERSEGHIVAVELHNGQVTRAMLVTGEDTEALIEQGIPAGADDADLVDLIEMTGYDGFDWLGGK